MFNRAKRTENKIGIQTYAFDLQEEIMIYSYLYGVHTHLHKKLSDNKKYSCYSDWKAYIQNKYHEYDKNKLINFHNYLIHRKENLRITNDINHSFTSAIIAAIVGNYLLRFAEEMSDLTQLLTVPWKSLIITIFSGCITFGLGYFLYYVVKSWIYNNTNKMLFDDYIKILDEMIKQNEE